MMNQEKYILTMLVENEPGVTARIAGLFAGRGYNIETICGAPTANPKMSRITITTMANPLQIEQCMKQIKRLVNVIKLRDMTGEKAVKREMALICVKARPENRDQVEQIIRSHEGRILDPGQHYIIFEVTGDENTIDELLCVLSPFGIKKLARSGVLALYKESEIQ
jgi:acetolactate synthase-1/3 small subunit